MKSRYLRIPFFTLLVILGLFACTDKGAEEIPLSQVPKNVMQVAKTTLPGITLKKAEREIKDKTMIYKLKGKLDEGNEYELEITELGTLVELELED